MRGDLQGHHSPSTDELHVVESHQSVVIIHAEHTWIIHKTGRATYKGRAVDEKLKSNLERPKLASVQFANELRPSNKWPVLQRVYFRYYTVFTFVCCSPSGIG